MIRNRAIQQFLSDFKFTKIRGLGGKLGDHVSSTFGTDAVKDLLPIPIEQLKQKIGDDSGTWIYQVIRGTDLSEVNSRTQIKSMLSAKSFRPSINTAEQAHRWLRIFVADIYSRLVDEGVLENKRRPKTMNLHHRHAAQTKSRQAPISLGRKIDETMLFDLAKTLMSQIIMEGRVWPCSNISLSVGGFEDGIVGNMGIGAFLVKGDEAKALNMSSRDNIIQDRPEKRPRLDRPGSGIQKFFTKTDSIEDHDDEFGAQTPSGANTPSGPAVETDSTEDQGTAASFSLPDENEANGEETHVESARSLKALHQQQTSEYICDRCNMQLESGKALQSHDDWHFAKDLQNEDRQTPSRPPPKSPAVTGNKKVAPTTNKKKLGSGKAEKGQMKLAFG